MLNNAKIEQIIHIPTMCDPDFGHWSNNALAAFDYDADEVWAALGVPSIENDELMAKWLAENRRGFLIEASTPIPEYVDNNLFSHSWVNITSKWFYVENFFDISSLILKWQAELIESKRPKVKNLAEAFSARIFDAIDRCRELGYSPNLLVRMLDVDSAVNVAKKLVCSGTLQSGLKTIKNMGRADLSIESIMLEQEFATLFTKDELEAARWRLSVA